MRIDWRKVLKVSGLILASAGAVITAICLSNKDGNNFEDWVDTASDDDLAEDYEERRQQWLLDGCGVNGEKTPEMKKLDSEMSRRSAEKWKNDSRRSVDPDFRWTDANRWDKD